MGIWSKLSKGIKLADVVAAFLPATGKAGKVKTIITKTAGAERQVEKIVKPCLVFLLLTTPAFAQVSVPFPTPTTYQLSWDHDGVNTDGFLVMDGTTRLADLRPTRQATSPNYSIPFPALTPGVHTLVVVAYNLAGRAPESDPLVVTLILVPARVTNVQARPPQ